MKENNMAKIQLWAIQVANNGVWEEEARYFKTEDEANAEFDRIDNLPAMPYGWLTVTAPYYKEVEVVEHSELALLKRDADCWHQHLSKVSAGGKKAWDKTTPAERSARAKKAVQARIDKYEQKHVK
jgi:hypothetical protein